MTSKIDYVSTILALFDKPSLLIGFFLKIFPWWHVDSWPKSLLFKDPPSLKFQDRTDINMHATLSHDWNRVRGSSYNWWRSGGSVWKTAQFCHKVRIICLLNDKEVLFEDRRSYNIPYEVQCCAVKHLSSKTTKGSSPKIVYAKNYKV